MCSGLHLSHHAHTPTIQLVEKETRWPETDILWDSCLRHLLHVASFSGCQHTVLLWLRCATWPLLELYCGAYVS